jgi:hypothetical protein
MFKYLRLAEIACTDGCTLDMQWYYTIDNEQ